VDLAPGRRPDAGGADQPTGAPTLAQPKDRIWPAIATFAVLIAVASRPRVGLLAIGAVAAVGLLAAWVLVLPRRLARP
jgi:hypothetical protein